MLSKLIAVLLLVVYCCAPSGVTAITGAKQAPNVILFVADDMGWADVGYHSDHILTPNIDSLAADGVLLNHFYAQPICSPSRGALLTAVHPIHLGLQTGIIRSESPTGLPLDRKIWPQYLKERYNYATHIVGKWHQGFARREFTPTYRGFDSHVGYWTMGQEYYEHHKCTTLTGEECYYDFRHNMDIITNASDVYSTEYFTNRCLHIIDQHNISRPLFLYVAHQAVTGNRGPIRHHISLFSHIRSERRQKLAANAYGMDESIGAVMEALHSKHMLDNSIVIFISDNGGQPYEGVDPGSPLPIPNAGLNLPLRGGKSLLYEGGIRVPALVWSPLLNKSGYVSEALVHVTDLLPTVLDGIDGTGIVDQDHIYGVSQWSTIANDNPPVRWEIQHNVDPVSNSSAIRWFDWKLIQTHKQFGPSKADYGYQFIDIDNPGIPFPTQQSAHRLNSKMYGVLTHMNRRPDYTVLSTSTIECRPVPDSHFRSECMSAYCLFNVRHDPCEQYDLIGQTDRRFVQFLRNKIVRFNATSVPPLSLVPNDPKADPKLYNYTYVNWLDYYENENSQFVTD